MDNSVRYNIVRALRGLIKICCYTLLCQYRRPIVDGMFMLAWWLHSLDILKSRYVAVAYGSSLALPLVALNTGVR